MIGPKNWGMPLKITEKDFSRQASFDRQWDAYKKAFIDSFLKEKESKEMSTYTYNAYCKQDIDSVSKMTTKQDYYLIPGIAKVIYNPPATIILWENKTKTVVKCCETDIYDPEKGFAMAVIKKLCGNDSALFHKLFKTWVLESKDAPEVNVPPFNINVDDFDPAKQIREMIDRIFGVGGSDGN